jgi:hypothetical protein
MSTWPTPEPPAARCSGKIQPGTAALMSWLLGEYRAGRNWGIYNCRLTAGGSPSVHGDGRAGDIGFAYVNGRPNPQGYALVERLLPKVGQLGIQRIIWARTIWDIRGKRAYTTGASHNDHVHWEQTWSSARNLTLATIRAVMASQSIPAPRPIPVVPPPTPQTIPTPRPEEENVVYLRVKETGAIFRVGQFFFEHMRPSVWAAEKLFNGATAATVPQQAFTDFVRSLGLRDIATVATR